MLKLTVFLVSSYFFKFLILFNCFKPNSLPPFTKILSFISYFINPSSLSLALTKFFGLDLSGLLILNFKTLVLNGV